MRISDWSSDVCSSDLSIAGRAIDRDAGIHQSLAGFVDILDLVSEMPEVATAGIFLPIPVISEFDLRILVTGRSKKDEREASFLVLRPPLFLKAQEIEKDRKSTRLNSSH